MYRWRIAQEAEKEFWKSRTSEELGTLARRKKEVYVPEIVRWVESFIGGFDTVSESMILQVGCAAVGTLYFFPSSAKRSAIEPLADFFKRQFPEYVDPGVNLTKGVGERLPYKDETFDLVLLENVLDHCYEPKAVVQEVYRVIKNSGALYVLLHFTPTIWKLLQFGERLKLPFHDDAHPHHFDLHSALSMLSPPFQVVAQRVNFWKGKPMWLRKQELELVARKL